MGIEDCAVLSELLSDESITKQQDLNALFAVFNDVRRERGQWLVQSSQHIGNCYEWIAKDVGDDFDKIEHEINTRNSIIANVDVRELCEQARGFLGDRLASSTNSTNGTL